MARAELLESEAGLQPYIEGWDRLAVARGRPLTAPAWMLAWWRHLAPEGAELRVVVVEDAGEVIGVAPYYVEPRGRRDYRLLGSGFSQRLEPLAAAGREEEVASSFAAALRGAQPRPRVVSVEGLPRSSPWPGLLKRRLGGPLGAASYLTSVQDAPVVTLEGDFDGWLASKSSNFRSQMRRARRRVESEGGSLRFSDASTVEADVQALLRLHAGRWEGRGQSAILMDGSAAMLLDAARELIPEERFRLSIIDMDGGPVSAQLFMAAGGEVAYWNGGFDERYAHLKPAMVVIFAAVEDAFARGDSRLDLGGGAQGYKLRFADGNDPLRWGGLIPRGPLWPLRRVQLARDVLRGAARTRLSDEQRARLKRLLRR